MTQAESAEVLHTALQQGELEIKGQFTRGNNYTFLVNVSYEGSEVPAVYKPMRGEQPLWDFPENSLAGREVCAYLVSQALGYGMVPFTLLRDGPLGPGSLQQYIDHDPNYHYFNFKPAELERLRPALEETTKKEDFKTCAECGEPSAMDLCKACELLKNIR